MLRNRTTLAALAVALLLPLSACASGPGAGTTGALTGAGAGGEEQQVPSSEGGGGGSASVPEDWPSDLPVPDGEIIYASTQNSSVTIQMRVSDLDAASAYLQAMQDAGYVVTYELPSDHGGTWALEKEDRDVTYLVSQNDNGYVNLSIGVSTE